MLSAVKTLLGMDPLDSTKNEQLSLILDIAKNEAMEFCNLDVHEELPEGLKTAIIQMAVFKYNRLGTEGLNSESYAGASYSYTDEYPGSIKAVLLRNRKLRAI